MEVNNPQEEKDNSKPLIKHQGAFLFPAPLSYQVFLESHKTKLKNPQESRPTFPLLETGSPRRWWRGR